MTIKKWKLPPCRQRGLSLLELIIGMMVGMMVVYGAIKIYAVSDGRNRSVGSKNNTQMGISVAAHALERDIILAGRGFSHFASDPVLGCSVEVYNEHANPKPNTFPLYPVYIKDDGNGPDEIHVFYGNSPVRVIPEEIGESTAFTKEVANKGGFLTGDKALLVKESDSGAVDETLCQIVEITGRKDEDDDQAVIVLSHAPQSSYENAYKKSRDPRDSLAGSTMNASAGTGVNDFTDGYIFSLGPAPVLHRWSVESNVLDGVLFKENIIPHKNSSTDPPKKEVALDIVDLQAEYGYYEDGCNMLKWMKPNKLNNNPSTDWKNVVAVRFALLARDAHFRPEPYQAKNPVWSGGEFKMPTNGPDWRRYSYEVREVVVPLRNYIKEWREEGGNENSKC